MWFEEKKWINYYNQARREHKGQPKEFITTKANELKRADRILDALTYEEADDDPTIEKLKDKIKTLNQNLLSKKYYNMNLNELKEHLREEMDIEEFEAKYGNASIEEQVNRVLD